MKIFSEKLSTSYDSGGAVVAGTTGVWRGGPLTFLIILITEKLVHQRW